jgi:replication-associated recombination protein RarA
MLTVDTNLRTGFEGAIHLPGTDSAKLAETTHLRQVAAGMASVRDHGGVIILDGPPGLGKTAATKILGRELNLEKRLLAMPNRPRGKETTARILTALSGERANMRLSEFEMLEDIVTWVSDQQVLLAIDEAQHLNRESFRQLRYLQDHDTTNLLLVFVGVNVRRQMRGLCPELLNRVRRTVPFKPYSKSEMVVFLKKYHPLYANTSPEVYPTLLKAVQGNLRNAATLLSAALDFDIDVEQGFTLETAKIVILAVNGEAR